MKNMNESDTLLKKNYCELKEWEYVLKKTDDFFAGVSFYDVEELSLSNWKDENIIIVLRKDYLFF